MTAQVQIGKKVIEFNGVDLPLVSITDETDSGVAYYCEAPAGSLSSDPV